MIALVAGCDGWSTPQVALGPVPLGPPGTRIVRLKSEQPSFEHTYTKILWDDGHGPENAVDRAKTVTDAVPKELLDRLNVTRKDLDYFGKPFDTRVYDARAVVVSLIPDVLIVSLRESRTPKKGEPLRDAFFDWDQRDGRWQIVAQTLERFGGFWDEDVTLYAGRLVPWTDEMYAFSNDPRVRYQRLAFTNGQAIVPLPNGRLVLRRRDLDVDVDRE